MENTEIQNAGKPLRWVDVPFAPRKFPFFYGWVIVAVATLGIIASIPGQTMSVGVFTDYLLVALGLTREQLSRTYMFGTIAAGILLPLAGRMLDRIGTRAMIVTASLGLSVSLCILSCSDRIAQSISADILTTMIVITMCFMLVRFFGQGCITMASRISIGKWFNHRRGIATAISGVPVSFAFSIAPLALNELIGIFQWRGALVALALMVGVGMALIGWLFYRDNPEQCGLVMDGITDEAWRKKHPASVSETVKELTRTEAAKTLTFWVFSFGMASYSLMITALTFNITSIGSEMGRSREEAFAIFLPMAVISVVTRFVSGWICDRTRTKIKWLLVIMMLTQALGTIGVILFRTKIGWALTAAGYGMCGGLFGTIFNVAWPRFFGRKHLGAVSGLTMSIIVFASAIGPWFFSIGRDITQSYQQVTAVCLLMPLLIGLAATRSDNPQEKFAASQLDVS